MEETGARLPVLYDANRVVPRLWIGEAPEPHFELEGFDLLVLAAKNHQPSMDNFAGTVIRPRLEDGPDPITEDEKACALLASKKVARCLFNGGRVLSTCISGLNRSSLVAGLALKMSTRLSTDQIVYAIRRARTDWALSNESFERFIHEAIDSY